MDRNGNSHIIAADASSLIAGLRVDVAGLRDELTQMRRGMDSLQAEVTSLRQSMFILQSLACALFITPGLKYHIPQ